MSAKRITPATLRTDLPQIAAWVLVSGIFWTLFMIGGN